MYATLLSSWLGRLMRRLFWLPTLSDRATTFKVGLKSLAGALGWHPTFRLAIWVWLPLMLTAPGVGGEARNVSIQSRPYGALSV